MVTWPATCQKMFLACAPPVSVIFTAELIVRSPEIWKIQTSFAPPEIVMDEGNVTVFVHLYRPGARVKPPILPVPSSEKSGVGRPAASLYAVIILFTAVVRLIGVGSA